MQGNRTGSSATAWTITSERRVQDETRPSVVGPTFVEPGVSQTGTNFLCPEQVVVIRVDFGVGDEVESDEPTGLFVTDLEILLRRTAP